MMKFVFGLCCMILLLQCHTGFAKPAIIVLGGTRCINLWDEGCVNGQLQGAGNDDDFLNGGFNPGKRCLNTWDKDCNDGPMPTEGDENNQGGELPSERLLYKILEQMRRKHQIY